MKKNFHIVFTAVLLLLGVLTSCGKIFVEPEPSGSAEKNFEIFWSDIYNTYPYFTKDHVDWVSLYKQYRPQVTNSTTDVQLFYILTAMLDKLNDQHRSLTSADKSLKYLPSRPYYDPGYDSSVIFKTYLNNRPQHNYAQDENTPSKKVLVSDYGMMSDSILYYHVDTYFTEFAFDSNFATFIKKYPQAKGLILDLRNNLGGDLRTAIKFFGVFFNTVTNYALIQEKTGPLDNDFSPPENLTIYPSSIAYFSKPMVVLANRYTASAAEHTVMAMKLRSNTTFVGDTTLGAFSYELERTLPNGMVFECISLQTTDVHGNFFEGIGIPPQVLQLNPYANLQPNDKQIDKAIQILQGSH